MDNYELGQIVNGVVVEIASYGAFIQCDNGQKGLLHISELSSGFVTSVEDMLKVGDTLRLRIVSIDPKNQYLRLSLKQGPDVKQTRQTKKIRIRLPESDINFAPLRQALPGWIEKAKGKKEE